MYTSINSTTSLRNKRHTKVLLALSVVMLILSCPLKRILQVNLNTPVSVERVFKQKSGSATSIRYNFNSSCSPDQNTVVALESKFSSHPKPHQNFAEFTAQSGFDIPYSLSRSKRLVANPEFQLSSLPLFLRHRSLLI